MIATMSERDTLAASDVTANATSEITAVKSRQSITPKYVLSGEFIYTPVNRSVSVSMVDSALSPKWLTRAKQRIQQEAQIGVDWDSYGSVPVDQRIPSMVEDLVEWFTVAGMPPPDVFATNEGGMQIEWHIRQVNVEIHISPTEPTQIFFHDIHSGEELAARASPYVLHKIRKRLLVIP